ncbi:MULTISPECIES: ABC transporter permease [Bacillus]|nr:MULTISPECIES: ABC transporter permease [Bacillus]MBF7150681.1 ABC transporter permease [Bacillus toyonensis]MBY7104962.1 ABC transporter permease [Bacillus sp. 6YEL31]MBY7131324.1 ABC transporter permease [Bacillus sp. 8YEL33]MEC2348191.1 ABC transporter permease [Bacillus toyonensis]MED3188634.1 ABC transporter permease [Bacillus toyonensis]
MSLLDSIKIALSSILAHKLRSALTMLGIIIGVGSIITVVAIGKGGEAMLKSQFTASGNNTIPITYKEDINELLTTGSMNDKKPSVSEEDLFELKKIKEIKNVIIQNSSTETLIGDDKKVVTNINGITKEYFNMTKIKMEKGRSLNEDDLMQGNNVIMVNQTLVKELFPNEHGSVIGKIIEIKGQPLQIIGLFSSEDEELGFGMSEILIPLSIWPILYGDDNSQQSITIQAIGVDQLQKAGKKGAKLLNDRKSEEFKGKYEIVNLEEIQQGISKVTNIMTMIIAGIASISLVVGGIGVMNIMLVSVTERTREIGVRKALGATRGKILLQFLIEAIMLTLLGGLIGIGLGYCGAYIVSTFAKWPPLVSWEVVVGGVLFSMSLGIVFGLIPANKAAKLDPIEALRYE